MGESKRLAAALGAVALLLLCGCEATKQVKGLVRKTGLRTSTTPDPLAFKQVPERNLGEARAAANALNLAREYSKLTDMRKELSKLEVDLSEAESKAADSRLLEKHALFKKSQFEAIDQAGLGDKEDNIAAIGKLSSQATKHESVAIKAESKVTILRRRTEESRAAVEAQAQKVAGLEGGS